MKIDIPLIQKEYFTYDKSVPYKLRDGNIIYISPILLEESWRYDMAVTILLIDKNASSNVEDIQMSYLAYLYNKIFAKEAQAVELLGYLLSKCVGLQSPVLCKNANKIYIKDNADGKIITAKEFDDISKIILYQNNIHYDDTYIDADFRKAMQEMDEIRNRDYEQPSLERQIAIITAHCGIPKSEQIKMTYRSHQMLFDECAGEVEFETVRPVAMYCGKGDELSHWIWSKKNDKYSKYMMSVDNYNKSMGGDGKVETIQSNHSDALLKQFNSKIGG